MSWRVISTLVAGVVFFAGLLAGWDLHWRAGSYSACRPAAAEEYNWGDKISVGGVATNVTNYFMSHLSVDDIKANLE